MLEIALMAVIVGMGFPFFAVAYVSFITEHDEPEPARGYVELR